MNGPTKNRQYNAVLARWAESGHDAAPACEECGCSLIDQDVIETDIGWFCVDCAPGIQTDCDIVRRAAAAYAKLERGYLE